MTIEIKIPAGQLALQYHIGQALRNAAVDAGYITGPELNADKANCERTAVKTLGDASVSVTEKFTPSEVDSTTEQVDDTDTDPTQAEPITPDTPDADGIVWDKRIHSQGQTRNADGTWRLARKPKDKSETEWNEYVETVKAELLAVVAAEDSIRDREQGGELNSEMGKVDESGEVFTDPVPPVTETVADPVPPVTETVADPVPPVTETVADPVPPVTETVADPVDEQLTFAKVIAFATANKSKLPPMDELNKVYADLAASMNIPVTNANAPIVAFAKAGPNVLSTLKTTIEGLING